MTNTISHRPVVKQGKTSELSCEMHIYWSQKYLFFWESFGDVVRKDVCLSTNIIKLEGTQLEKYIKRIQQQCLFPEILTQLLEINHRLHEQFHVGVATQKKACIYPWSRLTVCVRICLFLFRGVGQWIVLLLDRVMPFDSLNSRHTRQCQDAKNNICQNVTLFLQLTVFLLMFNLRVVAEITFFFFFLKRHWQH